MRKWIPALTLILALSAVFPTEASTLRIAGTNDPFAPPPAVITPITGVDGPLAPAAAYTLPYRADGRFDFSAIDLGAGITLRFDAQMKNVKLLSLGNILIVGAIEASGIQLALETPGQIFVSGSILADSVSLVANSISLTNVSRISISGAAGGTLCLGLRDCVPKVPQLIDPLFSFDTRQVQPSGNLPLLTPGVIRLAVPEPATPWLVITLLPLLILLGRKRTSHGC